MLGAAKYDEVVVAAQAATQAVPSLAAAINPTGDLPFTEIEGALVVARFAGRPQFKLDTSVARPISACRPAKARPRAEVPA